MKLGVVFPQTEIGSDPGAVREYAQAAESMGYNHILAFDHVLGANAESRPGWSGAYRHTDAFHEPFVLFGYLAAVTNSVELVTGVIILPQRQTALVAKQTAAVDVLSEGRLRLGIGIGWNAVEYEALGENFHDRGRRSEEQIDLLRKLWTNDLITYEGRWHKVTDAGLNPLPVQQPIPVWFGGAAPQTIRRVATMGDGWFPLFRPDDAGRELIESMREQADAAGRGSDDIGVESWVSIRDSSEDDWKRTAEAWRELGATHLSVNTMNAGFESPQAHIEAIERFREVMEG
ncbi:MAG: LLM class F420-dependent oxidoreductase [Dehalococcoidia bacterium]|nr:LLM class F420-dependent oxidoreductase [Dehalococcoidia bacterium]